MKEIKSYIPEYINGVILLPESKGNHLQNMGYKIKICYQKDENIKIHILLKKLGGKN